MKSWSFAPDFQGVAAHASLTRPRRVAILVIGLWEKPNVRTAAPYKLAAYRDAGVTEVWLADPRPRTIQVLVLNADGKEYIEKGVWGVKEITTSDVWRS